MSLRNGLSICCCCLPCNHCSNWTWVVEEILAFGTRLLSTHCREFNYLKLCRPAYFVRTTQLLPHPHLLNIAYYTFIVSIDIFPPILPSQIYSLYLTLLLTARCGGKDLNLGSLHKIAENNLHSINTPLNYYSFDSFKA